MASQSVRARFGTFAGVFTPNVLTILGIILFLRSGWVVGQVGLPRALVLIGLANAVSFLTGLSISAIATSMRVGPGGNYYMISRTLGLEIGGAIGVPLYLSQAISVAFYVIGFTEALVSVVSGLDPRIVATTVALGFGFIAYVGADVALKIQFVVLTVLALSLISFFTGGGPPRPASLVPHYTAGQTFWTVFAVFFPAVTGIEAGTSLSGDLRDPRRSIPIGTMTSVVCTATIYLATAWWLATHATAAQLIDDNLVMQRIARWPALILAGVFAATLSSALGSILAAPRTLQALAVDHVAPRWCAGQLGSPTEPRVAVLVTTAIAVGIIWLGDLNFVAPIITMFFLNSYGMVNLVAGIERLVGNPSFRPELRLPGWVSLVGAAGCYGAMFLINAPVTVVAIVISYGIFVLLERRSLQRTWGDVRSGIWLSLARRALLIVESQPASARNWRPNVLVLTGQPYHREELARVAHWLTTGQGVVSFTQLLVGDAETLAGQNLAERAQQGIRRYIREHRLPAFAAAQIVTEFESGALAVAQGHGVGGLAANTVLMGFSGTAEGRATQLRLVRQFGHLGRSTLLLKSCPECLHRRRIDVWWGGAGPNGELMLLLGHLLCLHPDWAGAELRLCRVIGAEQGHTAALDHMNTVIDGVRVRARAETMVREREQTIGEVIARHSTDASLTLFGLARPEPERLAEQAEQTAALVAGLNTVLLVHSGHKGSLLLAV